MTLHSLRASIVLLLGSAALAGCSTFKPPEIAYDELPASATLQSEPPNPVRIVEVPKLLPLPGQLKILSGGKSEAVEPRDPKVRVEQANAAARMQPRRAASSVQA